jgi:hypothetical protein
MEDFKIIIQKIKEIRELNKSKSDIHYFYSKYVKIKNANNRK